MKGASGCRQTVMNDPGAQQPSQMFFTLVKTRPQHRELMMMMMTKEEEDDNASVGDGNGEDD